MSAVSFLFLAFLGGYGIAGNIKVIKEEENNNNGYQLDYLQIRNSKIFYFRNLF